MPLPPSQPKRRRWLGRIGWNLLLASLTLLVLVLLAVLFVTPLSVWAVNRLMPEWFIAADRITIGVKGGVTLHGLKVRLRGDGSDVLSLKKARVSFSWQELFQHHLASVDLNGLGIAANDTVLAAVQKIMPSDGSKNSGWTIGQLTVRNGSVKVALTGRPDMAGRFDAEILSMAAQGDGGKPDSVRLREWTPRSRDGRAIVTIPDARIGFRMSELSAGHLRRLAVDGARVALTQEDIPLFAATAPSAGPAQPWRVDDLAIERSNVRMDLAEFPMIEATVALHAADLRSTSDGPQSPGELRIVNLSASPRESRATPASLAAATVRFTGSEILAGHIREVRLDGPSLSFNDAWQDVVSALMKGGASTPSAMPLKIDRLVVDGAKTAVSLPGMPTIEGMLGAQFTNLGSTDATVQTIEFHDLRFGLPDPPDGTFHEWLSLPNVKVSFSLDDLIRHHRIRSIDLDGAAFRFDRDCRAMFARTPAAAAAAEAPTIPYVADVVHLHNARVSLDDLGIGVPPLDFSVNLDLANVPVNDPLSGDTAEVQTLELSNINFVSPLDPFVPVLALPSIFIRWTLAGLRARQIEQVEIIGPAIHVGPDLFWYMDLVEKHRAEMDSAPAAGPNATPPPPWRVKHFDATSGRLVLALDGQARLTLPMPFESHAENLDFQRMSDARLKLVLEVPEQDYENSTLGLHLHRMSGKIDFQLPPGAHTENLVQTLKVRDVRWKNFQGRDFWLGLTFDKEGIHGEGGGKMCSGEIRAGFTYFLDPRAPWTGWVSGSRVDLQEITDKLATGKASMTGRATVGFAVNGLGGSVTRVAGDFRAPTGGKLRITKLDDLIAVIPRDWTNAKRDGMRIGLETLRDFSYDSGNASFWLTEPVGQLHVNLDGQLGKRELEVNFNPPGDLNRLFLFSPFKP